MWSDERETKSTECETWHLETELALDFAEYYLGPTYYSDSDLSIIKHLYSLQVASRISLSLSIEVNVWF